VPDEAAAGPFAYAGDSPLNAVDPSGHWSLWGAVGSVARSVVHAVASGFDWLRHTVASGADDSFHYLRVGELYLLSAARRVVRDVSNKVRDAANDGIRAVRTVIEYTYSRVDDTYHAVTAYATRHIRKVVKIIRTAVGNGRKMIGAAARDVGGAAVWTADHVQRAVKAAAATVTGAAKFAISHPAADVVASSCASMDSCAGRDLDPDGGWQSYAAGIGGSITNTVDAAQCASAVSVCAQEEATGQTATDDYQRWLASHGVQDGSDSWYDYGQATGDTAQMLLTLPTGTAEADIAAEGGASRAAAGFEADSSGAVNDARGLGRPDNQVVFSGHGGISAIDASTAQVPEGTCIVFYCTHGESISDALGGEIETGTPSSTQVIGSGESVPDYWLAPPFNPTLSVEGNPITVTQPTRLSELLRPNMGICHWAACRGVG
jgi:hypothetical protein